MPLVRFEVRNEVGLGDPELYGGGGAGKRGGEAEPKALLEGVAVAGLVGILRQLGDLAEFAADVFHDLHEQVITTSARGRKVLTRVQNIEAALPSLEKAVKNQKSHIHFAYVPGSDWHAQLQNEQNQLLSSDLPRFMMDSYEECRDPPRLYLLDKFDNAGAGACLKRYSDPSYFKRAWDITRADKTGNIQREKRSQKIKRKGSRLKESYHGQATSRHRNGELQPALTAVQLTSRQFASPSTDGQSFSEHRSTPGARSNPDMISRSSSFGSKTRLSLVEQAFDTKPFVVPHENGRNKPSNIKLHELSDPPSPVLLNGANADDPDDDLKQDSLPDETDARSPSVKWDEKAAIIMSTSSVYCDDVIMDRAEDAEPKRINPGQKEIDHRDMETLEQQEALLQKAKLLLLSSGLNHHDEVPSETDNYMDALNTLESETETEAEFQTKNQVISVPSFNLQAPQAGPIENIVSRHPDSSVTEFPDTSQNSGMSHTSKRTDDFPGLSNAVPPEILQPALSACTAMPSIKGSPVATKIPESNADDAPGDHSEISEAASLAYTAPPNERSPVASRIPESKAEDAPRDSPEILESVLSAYTAILPNKESSVVNQIPESNTEDASGDSVNEGIGCVVSQPTISKMLTNEPFKKASATKSSPDDTTDDPLVISESRAQEHPGKNDEDNGGCDATKVSDSHTESLNESLDKGSATQYLPADTSASSIGVSSIKLWTNAGLFGLEPSKPPVFSTQDGPREDILPGCKEPRCSHSTEYTELHCSKPTESEVVDVPNGNTLITSSFVGKLVGIRPGSASHNSSSANQLAARTPDSVQSQTGGPSDCSTPFELSEHKNMIGKHTSISELLESEDNAENGAEKYSATDITGRNDMHVVSASSFSSIAQRFLANTLQRRTTPKYTDLPTSSGRMNPDARANDESTLNHSIAPNETVFQASQYEKETENGMNGLSKSSIFSSCHYSEKSSPPLEYMKISFHPMSAFEMSKLDLDLSDGNLHANADDMMLPTFQLLPGSSIPQPGSGSESEDDTFGRSYSYSSYDDLSPRLYSNSELWDQEDGVGLEEHEPYNDSNHIASSTTPISGYMGFEQMNLSCAKSTISLVDTGDPTLEFHPAGELPNFDTLMPTNNEQNGDSSIPHSPENLSVDEDQLPPPPPLPPMQWRMMRQTSSLEEDTGTAANDMLRNTSSLPPPPQTPVQEEHLSPIAPTHPQGHAKEVNDQKADMVNEMSNLPNISEIKSSLLQQIRDKPDQQMLNGHEKSKSVGSDIKSLDEREELLQQIRSKTFNLRRTNASKTNSSSQSTTSSNVVAILEKANAIRQAVASDEGGDDDNWSDI